MLIHFLTAPYHVAMLLVGVVIGGGLYAIASRLRRRRDLRVQQSRRQ